MRTNSPSWAVRRYRTFKSPSGDPDGSLLIVSLPACFFRAGLAAKGSADDLVKRFSNLGQKSAAEVAALNNFAVAERSDFNDAS